MSLQPMEAADPSSSSRPVSLDRHRTSARAGHCLENSPRLPCRLDTRYLPIQFSLFLPKLKPNAVLILCWCCASPVLLSSVALGSLTVVLGLLQDSLSLLFRSRPTSR